MVFGRCLEKALGAYFCQEVALGVFVRNHALEIQYLRASISEEQRQEFGRLMETTIGQIEAAQFVSHTGIRFPQKRLSELCTSESLPEQPAVSRHESRA